jgi:uncharacterized protein YdaU (DUF1376 family)
MTAFKANNSRSDSAQQAKSVKVWFPTYIGDFFTVTSDMTGHEVGAYQLIIAKLWKEGGAIAANDRQLAKLVKASPRQWKEIKETLWPLFEIKGGLLTHPDTSDEIVKAEAMALKKSQAARIRWANNSNAGAMQVHSECNADGMPRACEGEGEGPNQGEPLGDKVIGETPFRVFGGGK